MGTYIASHHKAKPCANNLRKHPLCTLFVDKILQAYKRAGHRGRKCRAQKWATVYFARQLGEAASIAIVHTVAQLTVSQLTWLTNAQHMMCGDHRGINHQYQSHHSKFRRTIWEIRQEQRRRWCAAQFANSRIQATSISINLVLFNERNGELFLPLAPGQNSKRETLSATIDRINLRYGKTVIKYGQQQGHLGFFDRK